MLDAHRNPPDFVVVAAVAAAAVVPLLLVTWHLYLQVSEKGSSYADTTICNECLS